MVQNKPSLPCSVRYFDHDDANITNRPDISRCGGRSMGAETRKQYLQDKRERPSHQDGSFQGPEAEVVFP